MAADGVLVVLETVAATAAYEGGNVGLSRDRRRRVVGRGSTSIDFSRSGSWPFPPLGSPLADPREHHNPIIERQRPFGPVHIAMGPHKVKVPDEHEREGRGGGREGEAIICDAVVARPIGRCRREKDICGADCVGVALLVPFLGRYADRTLAHWLGRAVDCILIAYPRHRSEQRRVKTVLERVTLGISRIRGVNVKNGKSLVNGQDASALVVEGGIAQRPRVGEEGHAFLHIRCDAIEAGGNFIGRPKGLPPRNVGRPRARFAVLGGAADKRIGENAAVRHLRLLKA